MNVTVIDHASVLAAGNEFPRLEVTFVNIGGAYEVLITQEHDVLSISLAQGLGLAALLVEFNDKIKGEEV